MIAPTPPYWWGGRCSSRKATPSETWSSTIMSTTSADRKSTRLNSSHANISYAVFCLNRRPHTLTLFPYTTLFRSHTGMIFLTSYGICVADSPGNQIIYNHIYDRPYTAILVGWAMQFEESNAFGNVVEHNHVHDIGRSEEHTSELQSRQYLVCRLLLEPSTPHPYTLSLHDALPISHRHDLPDLIRDLRGRQPREPDHIQPHL